MPLVSEVARTRSRGTRMAPASKSVNACRHDWPSHLWQHKLEPATLEVASKTKYDGKLLDV